MSEQIDNSKRIAKNTFYLYIRTIITLLISLYTSRLILKYLGVEDYGIYNVVGGVVTMFSLISGSLVGATQRFITFELAKNDIRRSKEIFVAAITIHVFLAVVLFILLETLGLWFLNNHMNIAESRMVAANWVFQASIFAFLINIVSIPYNASIIAHERMSAFAYIGITEAFLRLISVLTLQYFFVDRLVVYAFFMLVIAIIIRIIYSVFCGRNFEECIQLSFLWNKTLYKQMASFAGWNFIGSSAGLLSNQGVNVLLNIFSGVVTNAARGIAMQVEHAMSSFVTSFMTALNPQITKSYSIGNNEYLNSLIFQGSKYSYYLVLLMSLPVIIEAEFVLTLWLKIVPEYTLLFVRLTLIIYMIQSLSNTMMTAILATGKIKKYQIVVGGINSLNFIFSYMALSWGYSPYSVYIIALVVTVLILIGRLYYSHKLFRFPVREFMIKVVFRIVVITLLASIAPVLLYTILPAGFFRFVMIFISTSIVILILVYQYGLSQDERSFVREKLANKLRKRL